MNKKRGEVMTKIGIVCDNNPDHVIRAHTEGDRTSQQTNDWNRIGFRGCTVQIDLCDECKKTLTVAEAIKVVHKRMAALNVPKDEWPELPPE